MPADQSFARLLQLGKQQGGLTPHDLQQVLDVERLSTDELSDMLVRLDQAGVSVEIDPALLAPASGRAGLARRPDNSLPEGCEMPFKVPSEAPGQSSSSNRKLRLLLFRISPTTCVTKQFQLRSPSRSASLFC
jgi:hypothetical protein